tara:strand:- start:184 stop:573 length:390 start_codon:yes stop_codon:yes gene_type:complete
MSNLTIPSGIGTDIVDIKRFKSKPLNKNLNFYKKLFSNSEIKYCQKFRSSYENFAGKFAIKESVIKAIPEKISFLDITTSHSKNKPKIILNNELYEKYRFLVSVSHEKDFAIAFVIAFKNEKNVKPRSK